MVKKKVVWDEQVKASLREACNYIKRDSLQQAEKVRQEILTASQRLADHPEMHPPDKYFIAEDMIRVLRFRNVKQRPEEY